VQRGRFGFHLALALMQHAQREAAHPRLPRLCPGHQPRQQHGGAVQHLVGVLGAAEEFEPAATFGGPGRQGALAALFGEYPNLQAALHWCLNEHDWRTGVRFARALWFLWQSRFSPSEGLGWLRRLLALPAQSDVTPDLALAYVDVNTDRDSDAWQTLTSLGEKFPAYAEASKSFQRDLGRSSGTCDTNLSDLQEVLGADAGAAITSVDAAGGGTPNWVVYVASNDDGKVKDAVESCKDTVKAGSYDMRISVVPDSGTDELTGLAGTFQIIFEGKNHLYQFDYTL